MGTHYIELQRGCETPTHQYWTLMKWTKLWTQTTTWCSLPLSCIQQKRGRFCQKKWEVKEFPWGMFVQLLPSPIHILAYLGGLWHNGPCIKPCSKKNSPIGTQSPNLNECRRLSSCHTTNEIGLDWHCCRKHQCVPTQSNPW